MNNIRYFLIYTKKGCILAKGTDSKNIFIGLYNDNQYILKEDDKLEEVNAKFVAETLKNLHEEDKSGENNRLQWMFFITSLILGLVVFYPSLYTSTVRVTIFQDLFFISLMLFSIVKYIGIKNRLNKIYNKNYYTALKEESRQ